MRHFFAHVAGESSPNRDNTNRQTIIASCRVGEPLLLEPEPDNPQDENAVRVLREDGKQIGYLERAMAARLFDDLRDFHAFVAGVGRSRGPDLGVALLIVVSGGDDDQTMIAEYAQRALAERVVSKLARSASRRRAGDSFVVAAAIMMLALAVVVGIALRFIPW